MNLLTCIKYHIKFLIAELSEKPWKKKRKIICQIKEEAWERLVNDPVLKAGIARLNLQPSPEWQAALKQSAAELKKINEEFSKLYEKEAQKQLRRRAGKFASLRRAALQRSWLMRQLPLALRMMF